MTDEEDVNELAVLMKVLDIVKLRIEARELHNFERIQITQIANQFLPGTTIGDIINDGYIQKTGDIVMGDKYEAHGHAKIGAMGNKATVTTVTFSESSGHETEVDLASLIEDLQALRAEMRGQASTTEEDQAIVAVGQAISAAEQGDTSSLFAHLKSAGKWAFDLATAIGAELAAGALKSVVGF